MADQDHSVLLTAAQAALEVGNAESARRMVEQVLIEEPRTAEAWYLLSFLVERWEDQIACLRNALAVDPALAEAQERRDELEAQSLGGAFARASSVPLLEETRSAEIARYFAEAKIEAAGDPLDDPLQCPYCGVVNPFKNTSCSRCGREIVFAEPKAERPSPYLKTATILAGTTAILGLFEIVGPVLWRWYHISGMDARLAIAVGASLETTLAQALFGPLGRADLMDAALASALVALGAARMAVIAAAWFGAYNRWRWGYVAGIGVLLADIVFQVVLASASLAGSAVAVVVILLALTALVLLIGGSAVDFAVVKVRVAVAPDLTAKSADAFYRKGLRYRDAGMWAMAVANWRKAVGAAPHRAEFCKALGVGYMKLGRYDRAQPVLEEGRRLAPDDAEFDELVSLVHDMIAEERRRAQENLIAPLG